MDSPQFLGAEELLRKTPGENNTILGVRMVSERGGERTSKRTIKGDWKILRHVNIISEGFGFAFIKNFPSSDLSEKTYL